MPQNSSDSLCVIASLLFLAMLAVLNWVFEVQWAWGLIVAYPLVSRAVIVKTMRGRA
ncbi:hypothetical protein N24_0981 [Corynebacterium suranareeae]|uniref:Uncharacterized protein n=1 Tax=Corynebacterium suranareeae TaxID=2506452 RepID=A0A160PQH5_9CORY|nr:hypothetical protein [Corynebacterium suranareeae]BAU95243.1 hypothetical protein N24_0981 [Corynebacterium suranareeae]